MEAISCTKYSEREEFEGFREGKKIVVYGRKGEVLCNLMRTLVMRREPTPGHEGGGEIVVRNRRSGAGRIGTSGYGQYSNRNEAGGD